MRNCQPTWSGIFAVWSGIFVVWSGIFAAEKRAWQQYIRRNSGLPKKVVLVKNLFIGQKAEIKPTLEEAGISPWVEEISLRKESLEHVFQNRMFFYLLTIQFYIICSIHVYTAVK